MGRSVTFASLTYQPLATGVAAAPVTAGDVSRMSVRIIRIDPGARFDALVPGGSDAYLFVLTGHGRISVGTDERDIATESFAAVGERNGFSLLNPSAAPSEVVCVLAPPEGAAPEHAGLAAPLAVISRAQAPTALIADQKKFRRYFVGKEAAHSERGHAMIVEYEADTETGMHYHPNAESMFVVLTGDIRFVVDGAPTVLRRGQAVYFPMNNAHALRCAGGTSSASFLEFHIPAAFTTVKV